MKIKKTKRPFKKESKDLINVDVETEHIQGSIDSPISLIEYGDYECPYTGMAYPIVKEIMKRFKNKIYFVFRNFPLNDIHPHAQHADRPLRLRAAHRLLQPGEPPPRPHHGPLPRVRGALGYFCEVPTVRP